MTREDLFLAIVAKTIQLEENIEPWKIIRIKGELGVSIKNTANFIVCANVFNEIVQNSENAKLVSLNQKYLDSSGNEETQSQFEREKNAVATQEETVLSKNLKIEKEPEKSDEKSETSKIQTTKK